VHSTPAKERAKKSVSKKFNKLDWRYSANYYEFKGLSSYFA